MSPTAPGRPGELLLVRHGATAWSVTGRHTGRTDLALLPEGEEQARAVAPLLADRRPALVLTSPLRRARRTAELAGHGDAEVDDDLLEWDYGQLEGLTTEEIRTSIPDWTVFAGPVPGGETLAEVAARVDRLIARVRAVDGDSLVFAHGHVLRVLAARWCELDPIEGRRLPLATATLSVLGWEHARPGIRMWNTPGQGPQAAAQP